MTEETFNDPKLAINRVYTRKGDAGTTRLVGGQKVVKTHARIEAYGTLDELNSILGMARHSLTELSVSAAGGYEAGRDALAAELLRVQHELFNLGSVLATMPEDVVPQMPRVTMRDVEALEASIDAHNEALPPLRSFVLPGGSRVNAELHLARTVCRRAERLMVALSTHGDEGDEVDAPSLAYINRLSDALFVWSRWVIVAAGGDEVLWAPNQSATGAAKRADAGEGA